MSQTKTLITLIIIGAAIVLGWKVLSNSNGEVQYTSPAEIPLISATPIRSPVPDTSPFKE